LRQSILSARTITLQAIANLVKFEDGNQCPFFAFSCILPAFHCCKEGKMKSVHLFPVLSAILVMAFVAMACGAQAAPAAPTALPATETPTAAPTNTPRPTATPHPTATPDLAATEQVAGWQMEVQRFFESGYIDSTEGEYLPQDDWSQDWAQINWYKYWPYDGIYSDLMFGAHLNWSTASRTPDISGCGIVFGLQENEDHYAVFLDQGRILFLMSRGENIYNVGKTRGSGRVNFGNPAEADFQVLIKGRSVYVSVNGEVTEYTLSEDQTATGKLALTVLSGTNKDYGTRCEMTDIHIWTPDD
jgi:hypothetical protein